MGRGYEECAVAGKIRMKGKKIKNKRKSSAQGRRG